MNGIITNEMRDSIEAAGWEAMEAECTAPFGSYGYGEVKRDLSIFIDILDESQTFQDVQIALDKERTLQYCGFNAAYDKFFHFMEKNCPVHKADREYYS